MCASPASELLGGDVDGHVPDVTEAPHEYRSTPRTVARLEFPTVLDLVGRTPIVRLEGLGREVPELLAKLEYLNPAGP